MKRSALGHADCPHCQKAPTGVCFQHAGAKAVPDPDDDRRCVGVKVDGTRCAKWAAKGSDMCGFHGKRSREYLANAATTSGRRMSNSKLLEAAKKHLQVADRKVIDPLDELETLAAEAVELRNWFRARFLEVMESGELDSETQARLDLYTAALERSATLVTGFGKYGLEKRLVDMREELVSVVAGLLVKMIAEFVDPSRQAAATLYVQQQVAALEAPR